MPKLNTSLLYVLILGSPFLHFNSVSNSGDKMTYWLLFKAKLYKDILLKYPNSATMKLFSIS